MSFFSSELSSHIFPLQFNLPSDIDWSYIIPKDLCVLAKRNLIVPLIATVLVVFITGGLLIKLCVSRPSTTMESTTMLPTSPNNPDTRPSNNPAKDIAADAPLSPFQAAGPEAIHSQAHGTAGRTKYSLSKRGRRGSESGCSDTTAVTEVAFEDVTSDVPEPHSTMCEEGLDSKEELPDRIKRVKELLRDTGKHFGEEESKESEMNLELELSEDEN